MSKGDLQFSVIWSWENPKIHTKNLNECLIFYSLKKILYMLRIYHEQTNKSG